MEVVVFVGEAGFARRKSTVLRWTRRALAREGLRDVSIEIYLVGGRQLSANVHSYPASRNFFRPDRRGIFLGEVYLSPRHIDTHGENLCSMLIHGILHLLGYDHIRKRDRMRMEKRERELFKLLNDEVIK